MKIYSEISLENFKAWSGAVDTLERIRNAGKCEVLEEILEEVYPDGLSETSLNDILWFEPDWCYEQCGMRCESEIREELEEAREELEDLMQSYADDCESYYDEGDYEDDSDIEYQNHKEECWLRDYADDAKELEEKIKELEEELENI
jgi:hypothetical protein